MWQKRHHDSTHKDSELINNIIYSKIKIGNANKTHHTLPYVFEYQGIGKELKSMPMEKGIIEGKVRLKATFFFN